MNAEILLSAALSALRQNPPEGLDLDDVDHFFERNRAALLEVVRRALPRPTMEPAFARFREEHRLLRLLLDLAQRHLDHGGPADLGRQIARYLEAIEDHHGHEANVLFPFLREHLPALAPAVNHSHGEHRAVVAAVLGLGQPLRRGGAYDKAAFDLVRHHFDEEEAEIVAPALALGLRETPQHLHSPLIHHAADIERLAAQLAQPAAAIGEPTRWGGSRGRQLQPGEIDQNTRVVTEQGEHGLVTEVQTIVFTTLVGNRRTDDDVHYSYTLKLDSGRVASPRGPLYEELAWPTAVVPDVQVGAHWLAPSEVWSRVINRHRDISAYAEKASNARKPDMKRQWQRHSETARKEFLELHRLLAAWRWAHPDEPIDGLDARRWRLVTLESRDTLSEDERWELALLKRLPSDWDTRFKPGDPVMRFVPSPYGRQQDTGWTLAEIRGYEAILSRDGVSATEPLWMLKADPAAPLVETFTEPRYLRELASEMLAPTDGYKPYPSRGAVARAVKVFLAERGVEVSTRVGQGSMVTGIDLSPPGGRWDPDTIARMQRLLPGINVWNDRQASFEPWETVGDKSTYQGDYTGKSAGLLIPVEHLPRFAAILAGAMQSEGQTLNALGERRLAASMPTRDTALPAGHRGGATADQRAQAAAGCQDLDFDLPGHGRIRVVCGQEGKRDRWYNVYIGSDRYGFNGGRWARNLRPPEPVLTAIRERGVTIFQP